MVDLILRVLVVRKMVGAPHQPDVERAFAIIRILIIDVAGAFSGLVNDADDAGVPYRVPVAHRVPVTDVQNLAIDRRHLFSDALVDDGVQALELRSVRLLPVDAAVENGADGEQLHQHETEHHRRGLEAVDRGGENLAGLVHGHGWSTFVGGSAGLRHKTTGMRLAISYSLQP